MQLAREGRIQGQNRVAGRNDSFSLEHATFEMSLRQSVDCLK